VNVATTAAWSVGAGGRGLGSSSIDGRGVATTISMAGMLSGLTSRWDAKTWSISSPRPRYTRVAQPLGSAELVEVPHPIAVPGVAAEEAGAGPEVDLRSSGSPDYLGGGRERLVVEVPEQDHGAVLSRARPDPRFVTAGGQQPSSVARHVIASAGPRWRGR
jgi:hypothetical protein